MDAVIEKIKTSLLNILGQPIEAVPSLLVGVAVLFLTRTVARAVQQIVSAATERIIKSLSLRSLFVQSSYALTWATGTSLACVIAFFCFASGRYHRLVRIEFSSC